MKVAFIATNRGTAARTIVAAMRSSRLSASAVLMMSDKAESDALVWARTEDIATVHIDRETHPDRTARDDAMRKALRDHGADLVVLSGYNHLIGPLTLADYPSRILNVHPGPLPEFGGKGMYGLHLHEAVLAAGIPESAVTVHVIDEVYDHGPTLSWSPLPILPGDEPRDLGARARTIEGDVFVETLRAVLDGVIDLDAPDVRLQIDL